MLSPSVFVPLMFLLTLAALLQSLSVQAAVEQVHGYLSCDDECLNHTHKSGTQPDVCSGGGGFGDGLEPTSLFRLW